jgi:hypothetical protein
LGGKIAQRFGGQEHATAGFEREKLAQLLADAEKKPRPFDAVIVADATRWSRDNAAIILRSRRTRVGFAVSSPGPRKRANSCRRKIGRQMTYLLS